MLLLWRETSCKRDVNFPTNAFLISRVLTAIFFPPASQQNLIINGAIALQIVTGALTTGVAASGTKHVWPLPIRGFPIHIPLQIGSVVAALGGLSTILASYLAKVRGSGEPEFSTIRMRELNSFLREVETFILDHGSFLPPPSLFTIS
jgi:hypothetical protein